MGYEERPLIVGSELFTGIAMRFLACTSVLLLCASSPATAQAATPGSSAPPVLALRQPGLREQAMRRDMRATTDSTRTAREANPSTLELLGRAGAGAAGAAAGALGGGLAGYMLLPHSDCDCDDPGLREFVIGAAVGGVAGAALAAAMPRQRSRCSYGRRVMYGVVGALAGGALGLVAPGNSRAVFIPLGGGIGAGVASAIC